MSADVGALRRTQGTSLSGVAGLAAVALLVGARVAGVFPELLGALWTCGLKELTGVPCPTCGLTRVLLRLSHGDVVGAITLAPLPTLFVFFVFVAGAWQLLARAGRAPFPDDVIGRRLGSRAALLGLGIGTLTLWGYAIARSLQTGAP